MKGFGFLFLAALYGVSAQCAEVREGSASMFVPGSYQSCSMAFVGNGEAEAKGRLALQRVDKKDILQKDVNY